MKTGDYLGGIRTLEDLRGRCRMNDETGCWIWGMGLSHGKPAVALSINGKTSSHTGRRAALILKNGRALPAGLHAWQAPHCPEPLCCNPEHAAQGTAQQSRSATMKRLGWKLQLRHLANGLSQRPRLAKLEPEQVLAIRASANNAATLADSYGVTVSTINNVLKRRCWRDLEGPAVTNASVFHWRGAA